MNDEHAMRRAIAACRGGIREGQSPFGAAMMKDGLVLVEAHNTVRKDNDSTAHAEVNAIRAACRALGTFDLSGTVLYSTCEPCPMCLAASHWARIDRVVFGASISDAKASGFREMPVPAATLAKMGESSLVVEGGVLRDECARLFEEWKAAGNAAPY